MKIMLVINNPMSHTGNQPVWVGGVRHDDRAEGGAVVSGSNSATNRWNGVQ